MNERPTLEDTYMRVARVISKRSSCEKKKVGCIIVKRGNIISFGYNGTPPNWSNECEDEDGNTRDCVSHAESNAISKAASSPVSCRGATMFCTLQPCYQCSKQLVQSEIARVIYKDPYRDRRPIKYLRECGIRVQKYG